MIRLSWSGMEGGIGDMMARFNALPRHIAKKHLLAVIKRVGKDGVKVLKKHTPKGGTTTVRAALKRGSGGRFVKGSGRKMKVRGGALRRAAMVKSKYQGRNKDGYAYGVLGYKFGPESKKALWLEYGTSRGIEPRRMVEKTMREWGGPATKTLVAEMKKALEKAVREMRSGKNPGMSKRGLAAGVRPMGR
jgi:hypothetical protein